MGRLRVGSGRAGGGPGMPSTPPAHEGTLSGYGPTHGESVGYNARNPYAYNATQGAKAYSTADQGDTSSKAKGVAEALSLPKFITG